MSEVFKYRPFSPFSVVVVFLALMLAGAALIPYQDVRFKPERSMPELDIRFYWGIASPEIVEEQASRIEGAMSRLDQVVSVTSTSSTGSGRVTITFDKDADLNRKRYEISMQLRQLRGSFPAGMSYPEISAVMDDEEDNQVFMTLTVDANASTHYIRKVAEAILLPAIGKIDGISDIRLYGVSPNQWEIMFDPVKLQQYHVSVEDIETAISRQGEKIFLGNPMTRNGSTAPVYLVSGTAQPQNWSSLPVSVKNGRIIRLSDLANVRLKEQLPVSYYRINGKNTINIVLFTALNTNQIRLSGLLRQTLANIENQLPLGYSVTIADDSSEYITGELRKIGLRTLFSLLILLLFVLLSTRSFRVLGVLSISLAANLLIALIFYYFLDVEIHLYSLAGITVSFGIIIDNSILMVTHLRQQKGLGVFLAILAATLTTLGSLSVIFFLKENQKVLLVDFVYVMLINLTISMAVALFLVPALMSLMYKPGACTATVIARKRRVLAFTGLYNRYISFGRRFRRAFIVLAILMFGLPIWLIPDKISKETQLASLYNKTLGSDLFLLKIKPVLNKVLGGSLRLFKDHVFETNFYADPSRTTLYVRCKMPDGCTVQQLNEAIRKLEQYLCNFEEIEQFQTSIRSAANGSVVIYFNRDAEKSSFPYLLKSEVEQFVNSLGGMESSVYGVGRAFSNALSLDYKDNHILLTGYNYYQLYGYAEELEKDLLKHERVKNTEISSSVSWYTTSRTGFFMKANPMALTLQGLNLREYTSSLFTQLYYRELNPVYAGNDLQRVVLVSGLYNDYNKWDFYNQPVTTSRGDRKLSQAGAIEKRLTGKSIYRKDQVYHLYLNYNFIGPSPLSKKVKEQHIEEMNGKLPLGYKASAGENWYFWSPGEKKQYYLLVLVILIIWFICSILFESLLQPLVVIFVIPISYIGVFLTFYLFGFSFDQGGFASFILLSGLAVNAAIYIINDLNHLVARRGKPLSVQTYLKAYNQKINAIMLTTLSTVLGLLPFLWGQQKEVFWFAFAAGSMGGMVFSLIAIMLFLPLVVPLKNK